MNFIIGYLLIFINVGVAFYLASSDMRIFLDLGAMIIVVGSTLIWAFIAYRPTGVTHIFKLIKVSAKRTDDKLGTMMEEVINVSKETRGDITQQFVASFRSPNKFLEDGLQLIVDGFSLEQIDSIMDERILSLRSRYDDDEQIMKNVKSVPPAFGMLGTTVGLIALFAQLGGENALAGVGPAMALALISTVYGLLFSYCAFSPLSERISLLNTLDIRSRSLTKKGVLLLKQKSSPSFVEEMLTSYLDFQQQNQRKGK